MADFYFRQLMFGIVLTKPMRLYLSKLAAQWKVQGKKVHSKFVVLFLLYVCMSLFLRCVFFFLIHWNMVVNITVK